MYVGTFILPFIPPQYQSFLEKCVLKNTKNELIYKIKFKNKLEVSFMPCEILVWIIEIGICWH